MAVSEFSLTGTWNDQKEITEAKQESEVDAVVETLKILNKKTTFISQKKANGGLLLLFKQHIRDTVERLIRHGYTE